VEISNLIDKAIIESFKLANERILPRKAIIKIVQGFIDRKDSIISKRIEKISDKSHKYLIRTSRGLYKLNPEVQFKFVGERLPSKTKSVEVSSKAREEHTEDLKKAVKNWIENFPKIPYYENSHNFLGAVNKCEDYPLFKDLLNHLSDSDYDICQRWEKYKNGVKEEGWKKKELLELFEKGISGIFKGLNLKFVRYHSNLSDFECSLPFLIYDSLIYSRIGVIKIYKELKDLSDKEEEQLKFADDVEEYRLDYNITVSRISDMIIFEKGDSAIWGETIKSIKLGCITELWECMRVPKKDIDIPRQNKDEAISIFDKLAPEIEKSIKGIIAEVKQLEEDEDYLTKELNDALFYKVFLGECKYLGEKQGEINGKNAV